MYSRLILIFLLLPFSEAFAQSPSERTYLITSDTLISDSLTIITSSVIITDPSRAAHFSISSNGKELRIYNISNPVVIKYSVLPYDLNKPYHHRTLALYDSMAIFKDPPPVEDDAPTSSGWLNSSNISRQGAISRGITIGSNQSMTMQSRLNLQLEGKLNDDLNISAQITDQQVPYLPEGNSQYLRDFDNVSVRLSSDKFSIEAGNQLWKNNSSFFGQYSRNVEGAQIKLFRKTEKGSSVTYGGVASARGKFARQQLPVEDGIAGPYRIPRPSASAHVVILPGSEKVYLDGEELLRGIDNDYIIDYNQGEITFTNEVILTRFSRVIIEFEYTQLSYQQSSIAAGHEYSSEKFSYFMTYFRQHDNARKPLGFDLSQNDLITIAEYEPDENIIYLPGIDSTGYIEESLMYEKKDTITADGKFHQYYYASVDPEKAHFRLSFREAESGNYIIKDYTARGKIYQWVAPVNGISQGNYEPVVALNAPETQQMVSLGGEYKFNDYEKINIEYSSSAYQDNNLSEKKPMQGGAALVSLNSEKRPLKFLDQYYLSHNIEVQWVDNDFNSLERYRTVEFDRLWLTPDTVTGNDLLVSGSFNINKSNHQNFRYQFLKRNRGELSGWIHQGNISQRFKNLYASADFKYAVSELSEMSSEWKNYDMHLFYKAGNWQPGLKFIGEHNSIYNADSLFGSVNHFREKQFYLSRNEKEGGKMKLLYSIRNDYQPFEGEFLQQSRAHTFSANGEYENLDYTLNYRNVKWNTVEDEEMLSGDVRWRTKIIDLIQQEISYGISQGRELSRTFQFVKVVPGEGTHTWRDMDQDGSQDLDEFFEAINIDERNYIKILLPTEDYVTAFENRLSYKGDFKMPVQWNEKEGIIKMLSRIRGNVNFQSARKVSSDRLSDRIFAFSNDMEDSLLISEKTMFQSRLYFQRTREKLGGAINYNQSHRKQLFQVGFQEMARKSWKADLLYGFNMFLDMNISGILSEENLHNEFSAAGNYSIRGKALTNELIYTVNQQWRVSGSYIWQERNAIASDAGSVHNEIRFGVKHSRKETYINSDLRIINIAFTGEENTATGYALLEAMRPGRNIYWQLNLQQKLSGALRLSVFYDGRKSEDNAAVHMGRVQVTALF